MRCPFFKLFAAIGLMSAITMPVAHADEGGMLVGAATGGLLGSTIGHGAGNVVATAGGVVLGGMIGDSLTSHSYGYRGGYYGRPTYYTTSSANGYPYDMFPRVSSYTPSQYNYVAPPDVAPATPVTYIDRGTGNYCREFTQTIRIGNQMRESYGTACLGPDGSWHIVQ